MGLTYAEIITETVREPLLILDNELRVLKASRSFYEQYQLSREETENEIIYEIGKGQWNIPELHHILNKVINEHKNIEDYKLFHKSDTLGAKALMLNIHLIIPEESNNNLIILAIEDISKHTEAQKELEDKSAILDALFESVPEAILITDENHVVRKISRFAGELFGVSPEKLINTDEPARLKLLNLCWPNGVKMNPGDLPLSKTIINGETFTDFEVWLVRNEDTKILSAAAAPIRDSQGKITGAIGSWRDITERKATENALKVEQGRLRATLKSIPDEMWITDSQGNIIERNADLISESLGKSDWPDIATALKELELLNPDGTNRAPEDAALSRALRGEFIQKVPELIRNLKTGELRWREVSSSPIQNENGSIIGAVAIARDSTERKRSEEALMISEQNLAEAQRITHVGSWIWNVETGEVFCSAETFRIYGEEPFSLKVTANLFLEYVHPEDRENVKIMMFDLQEGRRTKLKMEFRIIRKDGIIRQLNSIGEVTEFTSGGKPYRIRGTGQDVTEQKLLEKQLKDERDFVTALVQTSGALIAVIDMNGNLTRFNKACEELTGYNSDEVIGRSIFDLFIPPDEREEVNGVAKRLFSGERWVDHENHWITKSGDRRFIRWRNSVLLNENGAPVLAVATGIDITDRKKTEESLAESEASLRRALEIAHLGNWELDLLTNHLTWSDEIYRIFGLHPQEFGATYEAFLEHVHPDDRDAVDAAYTESIHEGRDSYEIEHRVLQKSTGKIRYVHQKCYHIRDENDTIIRSVGMVHDITDLKQSEAELRESEERFAAAFRSVQDALIISDETGLIIEVNQTWTSHWGYSAEQSIGHRSAELGIFTNIADRDRALQIIRNEGRLEDFEILLRKKSGEIRNAILFIEKLKLSQKALMLTIIRDVTERKRAEEALQNRTKELEIANRDLESFSFSVSHDLRSPLTVIQGFSNILLEEYGSKLDDYGMSMLNHITDASGKMASIMRDLLSLARISRENMNCYEIDLNPIANSVVDELRQSDPQRNVQVNIAGKISAHADPNLMTIALRNLIENAWKYTGKNSNARIDIGINPNGNKNTLFIQDNGAGFDMKYAHKLFKPFERLHSDREFAGTGIGLAIVQRIIQRHGGNIWAESEIDKGSTFFFTLDCTHN